MQTIRRPSAVRLFSIFAASCFIAPVGCAPTSTGANQAAETSKTSAPAGPGSTSGMHRVPLTITGQGSALVNCTINGRPIVLILDTGAQGTVIDTRAATEAGVRSREVPGFYSRGVGAGRVAMRQGEVVTLDMAGFPAQVAPNLQDFSGLTLSHLTTGKTPIVGLLGFDVLRSYGAIIDLKEGAMYLRKRS